MAPKGGKSLGPGPKRFAETTDAVLRLFTESLVEIADRSGGTLSSQDIRDMFESYRDDIAGLDAIYAKAWDQAIGVWMQSQWDRARTQLVERLLVCSFDKVLAPRGADAPQPGKLSRRVVPGFITALKKMIGEEDLDAAQERARRILDRLRRNAKGDFDWQVVYDDVESGILVEDMLLGIAQHFDDMDKRIDWFISVVNSNLGPPTPGGADATWYFDEAEFHIMFRAMFEDMRAGLDTDNWVEEIEERHGRGSVDRIRAFFARLDTTRLQAA